MEFGVSKEFAEAFQKAENGNGENGNGNAGGEGAGDQGNGDQGAGGDGSGEGVGGEGVGGEGGEGEGAGDNGAGGEGAGDQGNGGEGAGNNDNNGLGTVIVPTEEQIIEFFKSKNRNVNSLDELFEEKVKEVNPYEGIIDGKLKQILDYKKETGRDIDDWLKLQEDIDKRPLIDVAFDKVKAETDGMNLTPEQLKDYLEETLDIDLEAEELSTNDKIKLTKFVKDFKDQFKADQEKYKKPIEDVSGKGKNSEVEMVTLADGQQIEKSVYEAHEKSRLQYLQDIKVAVDSVADTSLSVKFDNNGTEEVITYDYVHDKEDKLAMFALSEDLDSTVGKLFRTKDGFDHKAFAKAVWRLDPKNWEKEVSSLVSKAVAKNTVELLKVQNNIDFGRNGLPGNGKSNQTKKDIFENNQGGFGVKYKF